MISIRIYKTIADLIDSAQRRGGDIVSNINQMSSDLNNSEIPTENNQKEILEVAIENTFSNLNSREVIYTQAMLKFVKALQLYVSNNYSSINDFLSDNDTKVKTVFADLSNEVGFLIDPSNIEGDIS